MLFSSALSSLLVIEIRIVITYCYFHTQCHHLLFFFIRIVIPNVIFIRIVISNFYFHPHCHHLLLIIVRIAINYCYYIVRKDMFPVRTRTILYTGRH
jgi:hypothetical protein